MCGTRIKYGRSKARFACGQCGVPFEVVPESGLPYLCAKAGEFPMKRDSLNAVMQILFAATSSGLPLFASLWRKGDVGVLIWGVVIVLWLAIAYLVAKYALRRMTDRIVTDDVSFTATTFQYVNFESAHLAWSDIERISVKRRKRTFAGVKVTGKILPEIAVETKGKTYIYPVKIERIWDLALIAEGRLKGRVSVPMTLLVRDEEGRDYFYGAVPGDFADRKLEIRADPP